jgi:hypothetical protein
MDEAMPDVCVLLTLLYYRWVSYLSRLRSLP